jgi:hypothetical protein
LGGKPSSCVWKVRHAGPSDPRPGKLAGRSRNLFSSGATSLAGPCSSAAGASSSRKPKGSEYESTTFGSSRPFCLGRVGEFRGDVERESALAHAQREGERHKCAGPSEAHVLDGDGLSKRGNSFSGRPPGYPVECAGEGRLPFDGCSSFFEILLRRAGPCDPAPDA